jgi:CHAT domain-containing protein
VFALTRTKFEVKSAIVTRQKLLALVEEYKRLLHDPSVYTGTGGEASVPAMTRFATLSTQLYDYLLRPVDALLERNLVIIMSPEFENFPFHAIERQDRKGTVKYVVEITSVDYLPSLSSLTFKTGAAPRLNQVVAVGNPTGKNWSIDYELRDIRSFFKEATILISMDATWNNVKEAKADILQFSTDFMMGEGTSVLGMIALAKPQTPEEVTKVPFEKLAELQAPSIILLSNQYGQGFGLSPAHAMLLRINGTSDVFLNAWFSDRKAAKFFSEFFYTHLANGLAPGDAYRQALLNLIRTKDVNHPHSWGQFFHFGVG